MYSKYKVIRRDDDGVGVGDDVGDNGKNGADDDKNQLYSMSVPQHSPPLNSRSTWSTSANKSF